jgi:exodeoxyribonuclease VII large subunit
VRSSRIAQHAARLVRSASVSLAQRGARLEALEGRLAALDPRRVLRRGYAWLADADGHAVSSVERLAVGQRLDAVLADGTAQVEVNDIVRHRRD